MFSNSSLQKSFSSSSSTLDESQLVNQLRDAVEGDLTDYTETPICIFNVPKTLMATDPDSYIPQQVALGPYHFRRPDLYEMIQYKIEAAKRTKEQLQCSKFEDIINLITELMPRIRDSYHKFLDAQNETLAWMVAIDASFLLDFLHNYAPKGKLLRSCSSRMSLLFDATGRKSTHNAILRDLVMLENQIPIFVLLELLEIQPFAIIDDQSAEHVLYLMLSQLCEELSPFKFKKLDQLSSVHAMKRTHLLDFLYYVIVPKSADQIEPEVIGVLDLEARQNELVKEDDQQQKPPENPNQIKQLLEEILKFVSRINARPARLVKRGATAIVKFPWKIISTLPGVGVLIKTHFLPFFQSNSIDESNDENEYYAAINKPPLVEEITIPSVTELAKAGVHFEPTNCTISNIHFDIKKAKLYLPQVTLDVNTEVVLRNLVAFEACKTSETVIIARYTELMNGIIDSEEDLKLLRKRKIVLNRMKSDKEAVDMWNGMNKSVKLTKVPELDKAIADVNKYYNARWKVKVKKVFKHYVFESWKFLTFFAAVFLFVLMALESLCSICSCTQIFHLRLD